MAASLKICTAPAISPISSSWSRAGMTTETSPDASARMAPVMAFIGPLIARVRNQPSRTPSATERKPATITVWMVVAIV